LPQILGVMTKREIVVPHDRLLDLIHELNKPPLEYPRSSALAEALHLLGQLRQAMDTTVLETYLTSTNKDIAEGAADGLIANAGLKDFEKTVSDKMDSSGYASLNEKQRNWVAVEELDDEVNNGGWSQYFFNSAGDDWPDAVKGLQAMGSKDRLAIFQEAIAKFGKVGPATDRTQRTEQLSTLITQNEKLFEPLETRYFESKEVLEVLTAKYVIQNAADFK